MIKITISGAVGEGKTTLSLLIAKTLEEAGLCVKNTDEDVIDELGPDHFQIMRVEALSKKMTSVLIETVQVRR